MQKVAPNLYVGTAPEALYTLTQSAEWRLVNVAKTTHLKLHHWSRPDKSSPYYVIHETPQWISVNWVDADQASYFNYNNLGVSVVKQVLAFIQKSLQEGKNVLISCDQGQSRSPSVALLYLAKILHTIPNTNYAEARQAFTKIYPYYQPALGISTFLAEHWTEI
jgi:Predicted protein-tyrosine phosphatase